MPWFKVDDKLHSNNKIRKVLADEPAALALWLVAGSWSSDNTTDGLIPDHQLPWLMPAGAEELAQKLVAARLWRRVRGGYQFHEWLYDGDGTKRNPSAAEVEAERRKKVEAGRKGGLASGKTRSKREARASASATPRASRVLELPSRPSPLTEERGTESERPASQGAPLASVHATSPPDGQEPKPDLAALRAQLATASAKNRSKANARAARSASDPPSTGIPSLDALEAAIAELITTEGGESP